MQRTAIFESWLIGDGCYPPLHRDQLVNLAFQLRPMTIRRRRSGPSFFTSRADATCRLHGTMTRSYLSDDDTLIAALETEEFRCYIQVGEVAQ